MRYRSAPPIIPARIKDVPELEQKTVTAQQKWHQELEHWESILLNPRRARDHDEARAKLAVYGFCYTIEPIDTQNLSVVVRSARNGKPLAEFYAHQMNSPLLRKLVEKYPARSIEVENGERIKKITTPFDGNKPMAIHLIERLPTLGQLETIAYGFPELDDVKLIGVDREDLSDSYGVKDGRPAVNLFVYNNSSMPLVYQATQPGGYVAAAGFADEVGTIDTLAHTLRAHCDTRARISGADDERSRKLRLILRRELTTTQDPRDIYRKDTKLDKIA
ncbi:MAG: hypothetical protein ACE5FT_04345 [Candidatus Nanoarchaeia archaeon]